MTDNPPTFTADELGKLSDTLCSLSDLIRTTPAWCDGSALGLLAEADEDAIDHVAKIIRRLSRDVKFPRSRDGAYLPAPVPVAEPQSLRVQS
jgi:hypothetical protein